MVGLWRGALEGRKAGGGNCKLQWYIPKDFTFNNTLSHSLTIDYRTFEYFF